MDRLILKKLFCFLSEDISTHVNLFHLDKQINKLYANCIQEVMSTVAVVNVSVNSFTNSYGMTYKLN